MRRARDREREKAFILSTILLSLVRSDLITIKIKSPQFRCAREFASFNYAVKTTDLIDYHDKKQMFL